MAIQHPLNIVYVKIIMKLKNDPKSSAATGRVDFRWFAFEYTNSRLCRDDEIEKRTMRSVVDIERRLKSVETRENNIWVQILPTIDFVCRVNANCVTSPSLYLSKQEMYYIKYRRLNINGGCFVYSSLRISIRTTFFACPCQSGISFIQTDHFSPSFVQMEHPKSPHTR